MYPWHGARLHGPASEAYYASALFKGEHACSGKNFGPDRHTAPPDGSARPEAGDVLSPPADGRHPAFECRLRSSEHAAAPLWSLCECAPPCADLACR